MLPPMDRIHLLSCILMQLLVLPFADALTSPPNTASTNLRYPHVSSIPPADTCESRTINYITHGLASICLRQYRTPPSTSSGFSSTNAPSMTEINLEITKQTISSLLTSTSVAPPTSDTAQPPDSLSGIDSDDILEDRTFLTFEDWKRQILEKENLVVGGSKDGEKPRKGEGLQSDSNVLPDGGNIDVDFGAYLNDRPKDLATAQKTGEGSSLGPLPPPIPSEPLRERTQDTEKTSKERFNFASLDAGSQVMKANAEAKSTSAILKEDRDVYMLNTCQAKGKFFIVELSESILVETLALANFEFFSSTFRHFRVSVSDRYPVKMDSWVEIGAFEGRNSREIQAFIIRNPRIWARYLRIELLSHFGNEFYCPISLLRVHGRTMIQDILSTEQGPRVEEDGDGREYDQNHRERTDQDHSDAVMGNLKGVVELSTDNGTEHKTGMHGTSERETEAQEYLSKTVTSYLHTDGIDFINDSQYDASDGQLVTPWRRNETPFIDSVMDCAAKDICLPSEYFRPSGISVSDTETGHADLKTTISLLTLTCTLEGSSSTDCPEAQGTHGPHERSESNGHIHHLADESESMAADLSSSASRLLSAAPITTQTSSTKHESVTSTMGDKSSAIMTSYNSQPSTQESFFKNVSKRLQLLEANSTLSLKYIEEQSRILRDAFSRTEKRQLAKATTFLENLNGTVFEELRKFGNLYDQIWQSTVLELETQRDQARRETSAVTSRLNVLADELIFQKRMSIIQSVLLLVCLVVAVFSPSLVGGYTDPPNIQNGARKTQKQTEYPYISPPATPETPKAWAAADNLSHIFRHQRQISDGSSRSTLTKSDVGSSRIPAFSHDELDDEINLGGDMRNSSQISQLYGDPQHFDCDEETSHPSTPPLSDYVLRLERASNASQIMGKYGHGLKYSELDDTVVDSSPTSGSTTDIHQAHFPLTPDERGSPVSAIGERNISHSDLIHNSYFPSSISKSPQRTRNDSGSSILRKPLPALPGA